MRGRKRQRKKRVTRWLEQNGVRVRGRAHTFDDLIRATMIGAREKIIRETFSRPTIQEPRS